MRDVQNYGEGEKRWMRERERGTEIKGLKNDKAGGGVKAK